MAEMRKCGRPKNTAVMKSLDYEEREIIDKNQKKRVAWCLYCDQPVHNVAETRLKTHRNRCHKRKRCDKSDGSANISTTSYECNQSNDSCIDINQNVRSSISQIDTNPTIIERSQLEHASCASDIGIENSSSDIQNQNANTSETSTKNKKAIPSVFDSYKDKEKYDDDRCQPIKVVKTVKPRVSQKISNFIPSIKPAESKIVDESLLKFLVFMKGNIDLVNCHYFKKLLSDLRPAYKIPDQFKLLEDVLPVVHEKTMKSFTKFESTKVLLVSKSTDRIIGTTFNQKYQLVLVQIAGMSEKEDEVKNFILECQEKVRAEYNTTIFGITSEFDILEYRNDHFYFINLLKLLKGIMTNLRESSLFQDLKSILFDLTFIFDDINSLSETKMTDIKEDDLFHDHNVLVSFTSNLKVIRQIIVDNASLLSKRTVEKLLDKNFVTAVDEMLDISKHVYKMTTRRNLSYSIADAAEDWALMLKDIEQNSFRNSVTVFNDEIYKPFVLLANFLHPFYKGKHFPDKKQMFVPFIIKNLHFDGSASASFIDYDKQRDHFESLFEMGLDNWQTFWELAAHKHPKLSEVAINLLNMPAFTMELELDCIRNGHYEKDVENKILDLFYVLQLNKE